MSPPAGAISPTGRRLPHRLPPARPQLPDPHLGPRQLRARKVNAADPAATITMAGMAVKQHGGPTPTARTLVLRAIQQPTSSNHRDTPVEQTQHRLSRAPGFRAGSNASSDRPEPPLPPILSSGSGPRGTRT